MPRPSTFDTPGAWLQVGEQQIHLIGETEPGRAREMTPRYDEAEIVIGYGRIWRSWSMTSTRRCGGPPRPA